MKGSEKQIKWAEDIKTKAIKTVHGWMFANEELASKDELATVTEMERRTIERFEQHDDARWWIDNRNTNDGRSWILLVWGADEYDNELHRQYERIVNGEDDPAESDQAESNDLEPSDELSALVNALIDELGTMNDAQLDNYEQTHSRSKHAGDIAISTSSDELIRYLDSLMQRVANAEQEVADADKSRPDYTPAGQQTRSQSGARAVLQDERTYAQYMVSLISRRIQEA